MSRPNIILIFPDQWRGDCLGAADHPVVETPFLDQLAAGGTRFRRAYSPSPTCIATRACLATGLSPSATGRLGYQDGVPWGYPRTFMRLLRDSGYQTLCSGKTHFYPARARLGFEELALYEQIWQDPEHPSDYHMWLSRQTGGLVRDTAEELDSNSWVVRPWTHEEELHPTNWTTTAAVEQLERRDPTRPFFLQVNYHRPHPPIDPPLAYFERLAGRELPPVPVGAWAAEHDRPVRAVDHSIGRLKPRELDRARRGYYAQLEHLDHQIGRLWRYLKGRRLLRETWLVFASDHGEMLGDHHMFRKTCPFEGSAHVPLIVTPPAGAGLPAGAVCDEAVNLTDLMPTFLELGGVDVSADVEGRSILPLCAEPGATLGRVFIHGEHAPAWQFVTDGREKYAWHSQSGREWLFDLASDPQELQNLAGVPAAAERLEIWRRRLAEVLGRRPEDGLTQDGRLVAGRALPAVRPWLLGP